MFKEASKKIKWDWKEVATLEKEYKIWFSFETLGGNKCSGALN